MPRPTATVVIATRNRAQVLKGTLQALAVLDPAPEELILVLVAPSDTIDAVVAHAPWAQTRVRVVRVSAREGSIAGRDSAFAMATGDFVISLDDDSAPLDADFLTRLAALARAHPEAGTFTFREVWDDGRATGPAKPCYVGAYANAAVAIRRSVYARPFMPDAPETDGGGESARDEAGGAAYPRFFTHAYAEPDFCLQTYAAGHAVLHAPDILVRRRRTGRRPDLRARHRFTARNELWSVLMRCPFPHVLWVAPYRIAAQAVFALHRGWLFDEPRWWWNALRGISKPLRARTPVPWATYRSWMRLGRRPLSTRRDLVAAFPAVAHRAGLRPAPFALRRATKA